MSCYLTRRARRKDTRPKIAIIRAYTIAKPISQRTGRVFHWRQAARTPKPAKIMNIAPGELVEDLAGDAR